MDSKVLSFFNAFTKFAKEDIESNPDAILTFFKSVIKLDYERFIDCWEYVITKNDKLLSREYFDKILTIDTLTMARDKNSLKTTKAIVANPVIAKAIYTDSMYACTDASLELLVGLLITQKLSEADVILKLIQKNTAAKKPFGQFMVEITDKLFFELLKKQGNVSLKVDMPKKLAQLLTAYISKIRGPERALLEQRIREIM